MTRSPTRTLTDAASHAFALSRRSRRTARSPYTVTSAADQVVTAAALTTCRTMRAHPTAFCDALSDHCVAAQHRSARSHMTASATAAETERLVPAHLFICTDLYFLCIWVRTRCWDQRPACDQHFASTQTLGPTLWRPQWARTQAHPDLASSAAATSARHFLRLSPRRSRSLTGRIFGPLAHWQLRSFAVVRTSGRVVNHNFSSRLSIPTPAVRCYLRLLSFALAGLGASSFRATPIAHHYRCISSLSRS
jgi:hypothetical protein